MTSVTSSDVWYSLLGHVNGLYACLQTLIYHGERIRGSFGKSAVDAHLFGCETEMDSQNQVIDTLNRMCVKRGRKAVSVWLFVWRVCCVVRPVRAPLV